MNLSENDDDEIVNRDNSITNSEDLTDSPKDRELLKSETAIIDLPEVKDIPGQENIVPMPLGELADVTISSDDEEGVGVLDFEDEENDEITNSSAEVTNQGNKEGTETGKAIQDGAQLKDNEEQDVTNAREQALTDFEKDADK